MNGCQMRRLSLTGIISLFLFFNASHVVAKTSKDASPKQDEAETNTE